MCARALTHIIALVGTRSSDRINFITNKLKSRRRFFRESSEYPWYLRRNRRMEVALTGNARQSKPKKKSSTRILNRSVRPYRQTKTRRNEKRLKNVNVREKKSYWPDSRKDERQQDISFSPAAGENTENQEQKYLARRDWNRIKKLAASQLNCFTKVQEILPFGKRISFRGTAFFLPSLRRLPASRRNGCH